VTHPHDPVVDLTNCDREPIHIPGAIQPHGVLLALREPDLLILQASANLPDVLGVPLAQALGQPLDAVLDVEGRDAVQRALGDASSLQHVEEANPLRLTIAGSRYDGLLHRHLGVAILEIEPGPREPRPARAHHPLRSAVVHLQAADTLSRLCETIVTEVRLLTGFERVLIYRFDEEGHGVVEAEVKDDALDSYLGLRYPASDIPRQARELYLRNWLRIIPDARYAPVHLVPALRPDTGAPLDLSFSVLRSVSPIHLEYLANMGVRASMSVSLIVRGRLWGLISCANHSGPRHVSYEIRSDCELLGRLASLHLSALEDREVASRRTARQGTLQALADAMRAGDAGDDVLEALLARPAELLALVGAAGVAVVRDDAVLTRGLTPTPETIGAIADWLHGRNEQGVFCTASLAAEMPGAEGSKDVASGVLGFALPGAARRRILWFRPEILQTVSWGGDPRKAVREDAGMRLHPRKSFELWREEVRLRSQPWSPGNLEAAEDLRRHAVEMDLGKQVEREQRAVRARDELVAVVSHDLKNPLGVIQMQAALLRRTAGEDGEDRSQRLRAGVDRIQRAVDRMNALVHDLLDLAKIEAGRFKLRRQPEPVHEIIEEAMVILRPLAEAKRIRLVEDVSQSVLVDVDRERIFQVLSNLVGNAIKFTPEGGRIVLSVAVESTHVLFAVTDTGPGVAPQQAPNLFDRYWQAPGKGHGGTGLGLYIAKGIVTAHGGQIWFEPASGGGASFQFTLPVTR
jgi:two-component system, chemotaxis family, sensor kinase Cph1